MNPSRERSNIERRRLSPLLIMLGIQIFQHLEKLEHKPPVTIGLLACNILPHLYHMNLFDFSLSDIQQNCINPNAILTSLLKRHQLQLNRIILPAFMHADDTHLYYNMLSLLWKGINLERRLGSVKFLQLVVFSLLCSHILMVALSYALHELGFDPGISGFNTCAIGFSAVLFSLKYVWNQLSPEMTNVMGMMNVPSRYAAWIELVLISIISPRASFLGHLCGILAGMVYLQVVQRILDSFTRSHAATSTGYSNDTSTSYHQSGSRYTYASGTASRENTSQPAAQPRKQDFPEHEPTARPTPTDAEIRRLRLNKLNLRYT
jgi:rhomboid domain-containing protein 1